MANHKYLLCHPLANTKTGKLNRYEYKDMLPDDLLAADEQVIFVIKPSLWLVLFFSFRVIVIAMLIVAGVLGLSQLMAPGPYGRYIIQLCALAILMRVGFAFLQWLSRNYVLTDRRVIRIQGVFSITIFQCALSRIQNTFLDMTFYERLFGLGSISFATAGSGSVEATWQHIKQPLDVHRRLLEVMKKDMAKTTSDCGL